jgi:hypothetical protein
MKAELYSEFRDRKNWQVGLVIELGKTFDLPSMKGGCTNQNLKKPYFSYQKVLAHMQKALLHSAFQRSFHSTNNVNIRQCSQSRALSMISPYNAHK